MNNINIPTNLIGLTITLNDYYDSFNEEGKPSDYIDLSSLPVFSDIPIDDTEGVYSYDDNYVLVQGNGAAGEHFVLQPREDKKSL